MTSPARMRAGILAAAVFFAALVVMGALFLLYWIAFWPVKKVARSYVASSQSGVQSGIVFVDLDGRKAKLPLYSSTGEPLDPIFTIRGSQVLYWSWPDKSFAAMDIKSRKVKWYGIGEDLGYGRITCDSRFVSMDSGPLADERIAVLLDTKTEEWKKLGGVAEIRVDPSGTGRMVMLQEDGVFVSASTGNTENRHVLCKFREVRNWDYDFENSRLFVLRKYVQNEITVWSGNGSTKQLRLPINAQAFRPIWQSRVHELWVVGSGPTSATPRTLIFSSDLQYLGALPFVMPRSIVALDPQDVRAFAKSPGAVPER